MTQSTSERAICEIKRRLSRIRVADGYSTDAGLSVFRARRNVSESELPALVIWDQGESAVARGDNYGITLRVSVEALVRCDQESTGEMIECAKADVKRALLCGSLGALGEPATHGKKSAIGTLAYTGAEMSPREEGGISESIAMTFDVGFVETYGEPFGAHPD